MQDGQVPTDSDSEDGADDLPRRASLRLGDAEAVATVRRDMFGDGSLLDALAGPPPAPQDTESPPDPTASAQPAEPSAPEGDAAAGHGDAAPQADPAEAASLAAPAPFAKVAQSLDAIIDSFPSEPAAGAPQQPGAEKADASLASSPPDASPAPGAAADASEPLPDAAAAIPALQMGISSLFDSLGSLGQRADGDAQPVEEPPAPSVPTMDLDMSMLEVRSPARPLPQPESDPPTAASPDGVPPPSMDPEPQTHESQAHESQAHEIQTDEVQAGELDLDMSMLEMRAPARSVLRPEGDPYGAGSPYGDSSPSWEGQFQADGIQAGEVETDEQRVVEATLERTIDTPAEPDALAQDSGEPPFADVGGASPFLGRAAVPLFPERPDAAGTLSDFAEPPQDASAPPFIERLEMPAFAEPSELAHTPRYAGRMAAPSIRRPAEPANDDRFLEPQVMPAYSEPAESAERPMLDAADKIEAEAQATAEALDNLKRLLGHSTPGLEEPPELPGHDPAPALGHTHMRFNLHGDPTPFPSSGPSALMPLPVPPERSGIKGIYVLGFLTGLGLALMAGLALYVLINMV